MNFLRTSDDGKWGLAEDDRGGYDLYRIDTTGNFPPSLFGAVWNPENFDTAVDNAEEEIRCMMADAAEEFGWAHG